jgi:AcrR family transcriptional regulator
MSSLAPSPIFARAAPLPRGPHQLTREQVALSQRARLMAALTELLAEHGYAGVRIGELAQRAGVSRATFYEHFSDKQECLLAAYDHFATTLLTAMTADLDPDTPWSAFIDIALDGYLGTLERDSTAARAFIVEMDGAGTIARRSRRDGIHAFAALRAHRHATIREHFPSLGPLSEQVWLALALAVRELVREALEGEPTPKLTQLAPSIRTLITAVIEGAAAAHIQRR